MAIEYGNDSFSPSPKWDLSLLTWVIKHWEIPKIWRKFAHRFPVDFDNLRSMAPKGQEPVGQQSKWESMEF